MDVVNCENFAGWNPTITMKVKPTTKPPTTMASDYGLTHSPLLMLRLHHYLAETTPIEQTMPWQRPSDSAGPQGPSSQTHKNTRQSHTSNHIPLASLASDLFFSDTRFLALNRTVG
jgi:hypothetical protein